MPRCCIRGGGGGSILRNSQSESPGASITDRCYLHLHVIHLNRVFSKVKLLSSNHSLSQLQPPVLDLAPPTATKVVLWSTASQPSSDFAYKPAMFGSSGYAAPVMSMLDTFTPKYNQASTAIDCQDIAFAHQQQCASTSYQVRVVEATSTCYHVSSPPTAHRLVRPGQG